MWKTFTLLLGKLPHEILSESAGFYGRYDKKHLCVFFSVDSVHYDVLQSCICTLCLKKVPTFKLSITLSNLNRFSKFVHCWKAHKICYKTYDITHLTLCILLHYLVKIKIQIFCRYSADMEKC